MINLSLRFRSERGRERVETVAYRVTTSVKHRFCWTNKQCNVNWILNGKQTIKNNNWTQCLRQILLRYSITKVERDVSNPCNSSKGNSWARNQHCFWLLMAPVGLLLKSFPRIPSEARPASASSCHWAEHRDRPADVSLFFFFADLDCTWWQYWPRSWIDLLNHQLVSNWQTE